MPARASHDYVRAGTSSLYTALDLTTGKVTGSLNLVERWFAELTAKKLQRGTHRSVRALNADIRSWIATWNDDPRPYVWTKTADQILESIARYCRRINDSAH